MKAEKHNGNSSIQSRASTLSFLFFTKSAITVAPKFPSLAAIKKTMIKDLEGHEITSTFHAKHEPIFKIASLYKSSYYLVLIKVKYCKILSKNFTILVAPKRKDSGTPKMLLRGKIEYQLL